MLQNSDGVLLYYDKSCMQLKARHMSVQQWTALSEAAVELSARIFGGIKIFPNRADVEEQRIGALWCRGELEGVVASDDPMPLLEEE